PRTTVIPCRPRAGSRATRTRSTAATGQAGSFDSSLRHRSRPSHDPWSVEGRRPHASLSDRLSRRGGEASDGRVPRHPRRGRPAPGALRRRLQRRRRWPRGPGRATRRDGADRRGRGPDLAHHAGRARRGARPRHRARADRERFVRGGPAPAPAAVQPARDAAAPGSARVCRGAGARGNAARAARRDVVRERERQGAPSPRVLADLRDRRAARRPADDPSPHAAGGGGLRGVPLDRAGGLPHGHDAGDRPAHVRRRARDVPDAPLHPRPSGRDDPVRRRAHRPRLRSVLRVAGAPPTRTVVLLQAELLVRHRELRTEGAPVRDRLRRRGPPRARDRLPAPDRRHGQGGAGGVHPAHRRGCPRGDPRRQCRAPVETRPGDGPGEMSERGGGGPVPGARIACLTCLACLALATWSAKGRADGPLFQIDSEIHPTYSVFHDPDADVSLKEFAFFRNVVIHVDTTGTGDSLVIVGHPRELIHLVYQRSGGLHSAETTFGHAWSPDLLHWTVDTLAFARDTTWWNRLHVWSPSLIEANGRTY